MSLLTDASLIVTPNGYNVNKLYSVIPNTTLGDMAVTRGSSATRVNSANLIEIARTNLLLQSQTLENASWSKAIGGTGIAPVVTANSGTAPDGTMTADRVVFNCVGSLSADRSYIVQGSLTTTIGVRYSQSIYVKAFSSGEVGKQLRIAADGLTGLSSIITITANWQRIVLNGLANVATTNFIVETRGTFTTPTNTTADVLLWGAQLETSNIAVATEYIPTTTVARTKFAGITQDGLLASNIPRIDYPPLGGCPSILVEPARTNEISYSEEFDNAYWTKANVIITANTTATLAPDGTFTADKFIPDTTSGVTHNINRITGLASNAYTFSVFAKAGGETTFSMWLVNAATINAVFNLSTGTYTASSGSTASMTAFPNGWYRCSVYNATPGTTAHIFGRTGGGFAGNGVDGIFLWGAQVEVGANATSYIPTTTAAVPRAADVIKNTSATTLIGQTEGTIFIDAQITNFAETAQSFITISDGTINNRIELRKGTGSQIILEAFASTVSVLSFTLSSVAVGRYKIALAYQSGNSYLYINGAQVGTTSANTFAFTSLTNIVVGANATGSTRFLNDRINLETVFKTRLTPDQCILLTGPSFSSYVEMANNFPNTLIYSLQ